MSDLRKKKKTLGRTKGEERKKEKKNWKVKPQEKITAKTRGGITSKKGGKQKRNAEERNMNRKVTVTELCESKRKEQREMEHSGRRMNSEKCGKKVAKK